MPLPARPTYEPEDWYWIVAGSTTQVYSSAAVAFVSISNPTYQSWLSSGGHPSRIPTSQELTDVLLSAKVPVPAGGVPSDGMKDNMFDNVPHAVQVWAFDVDNRVRVLEGQPTRTPAQFRNYVKSLM